MNLFSASNKSIIANSIVTLMHETNVPRQDRINIAEALIHIRPPTGNYTISGAARDFIIKIILYPCLLRRVLTPHLDNTSPEDADIANLIQYAVNTTASKPTLTHVREQLTTAR